MVFQWFSMVANHWSDDGMVTIHRSGLIVGVASFQKIFGLCGLKCHIVEIWRDVTLVDNDGRTTTDARTECEDRARILETEFAIQIQIEDKY